MRFQCLQKVVSILLGVSLIAGSSMVSAGASQARHYTIESPYASVDWDNWEQYKANLHTHSIASDGEVDFDEMIEYHYQLGYDILAMTDHGVVDRGWDQRPQIVPLFSLIKLQRTKGRLPTPLRTERLEQIASGTDRGGRGMTRVPLAAEQNAAVPNNSHVNSFFADWGQGKMGVDGDYETVVKNIDALGGLTVINHPGEWTGARDDAAKSSDPKIVSKFASLFVKYDSCLGFDINSKKDVRTANDRILWDNVLQLVVPYGRNVWGFATSDAHQLDVVDCGYTVHLMPENTVAEVRRSMESGTFFAVSRYLNGEKLGEGEPPVVERISATDSRTSSAGSSITIEARDYHEIRWIADGEVIATGETLSLDEHASEIGCYVRAEVQGDSGILYTQPFVISCEEAPVTPQEIPHYFDWSSLLRNIVDRLLNVIDTIHEGNVIFDAVIWLLFGITL